MLRSVILAAVPVIPGRAARRDGSAHPRRRPPVRRRHRRRRRAARHPRPGRRRPARSPSTTSARTPSPPSRPTATRDEYLALLAALAGAGLTPGRRGQRQALRARARSSTSSWRTTTRGQICAAAADAGTTVTLDMEDHTTTDSTLEILAELRQGLPDDRRGAAGLPAPHRGRLPGAGHGRVAGAAVQGRLQGARVGGVPVGRRRGQVVRALHEHPDVRRRATRCWPPTTRG